MCFLKSLINNYSSKSIISNQLNNVLSKEKTQDHLRELKRPILRYDFEFNCLNYFYSVNCITFVGYCF